MKRHIVILRFSVIGDVAIAAPLVRAYALANPDIQFTMVSQTFLSSMFEGIENLAFLPAEFKENRANLVRCFKFSKKIKEINPTDIADFQASAGSRLICKKTGVRSAVLWKSRYRRAALTRRKSKIFMEIATMQRRYEKVFTDLGLKDLNYSKLPVKIKKFSNKETWVLGIAPFAKYKAKEWPEEYMDQVIDHFAKLPQVKIYLFGGGKREIAKLARIERRYENVESVAGKYTINEELMFMKNLDLMLSMDTTNMHFASFVSVPVLSIWGGTHPYAGFYGWGQDPSFAIQLDMNCRPCSISGDKKCYRGDYACMSNLKPEIVIERIETFFTN